MGRSLFGLSRLRQKGKGHRQTRGVIYNLRIAKRKMDSLT